MGVFSLLFVFLYGYEFIGGGKRQVREILHACSTTIRTGLLPFWSKVKITRDKNALSAANTHPGAYEYYCSGRSHFVAGDG